MQRQISWKLSHRVFFVPIRTWVRSGARVLKGWMGWCYDLYVNPVYYVHTFKDTI